MKICHIGSYNINLGDNIALLNVRLAFEKYIDNIEWVKISIQKFWMRHNNPKKVIEILNKDYDCILVGGGGLIEYNGHEQQKGTNYKLPFNKEILSSLNCPVFFVALGINIFRGGSEPSQEAKLAIKETIDFSALFSLRNDGSADILKNIGLESPKVEVIPDPGLIFDYKKDKKSKIEVSCIQPAFNLSEELNQNRYKSRENIEKLRVFADDNKLKAMPHSIKDFRVFKSFLISPNDFEEAVHFKHTDQLVKTYLNIDSVVAMRGHGQLISIGLNIPGLYLSTQDKVRDFSLLNGFEDFNVDIEEEEWYDLLRYKHNKLISDNNFLEKWYQIKQNKEKEWNNSFNSFVEKCVKIIQ